MNGIGWAFENSYAQLAERLYTRLAPTPVGNPQMALLNEPLAERLGLDFSQLPLPERAAFFSGNRLPEGAEPIAQAYAGHQFGHLTMLGDGRAIVVGEQIAPDRKRFDIQFKGSGRTPYSRNGDGRASLGPMLREYVISESMYALGIPTTRSLAVATTGEWVYRESEEPGAVLTRVAASHLRVGSFQYLAMQREYGVMRTLVDYALARHYPEAQQDGNPALTLLKSVLRSQVDLILQWMRVGFIHGVMNTDNVAISGETIDYGPCAFMDAYDRATVFSSIDHGGRYAFGNQPHIAQWNCARFAEALLPLLHDDQSVALDRAEETIKGFGPFFESGWLEMMRGKLGLLGEEPEDEALINELLGWMEKKQADYTRTFRALRVDDTSEEALFQDTVFQEWHSRWRARTGRQDSSPDGVRARMWENNPAIIPRNHKVEEALEAAVTNGDLDPLERLLDAMSRPYEDRPGLEPYQRPPEPSDRVYQTFCGT